MQLENEVYQYIRQMIDDESSRLEIVESCISEFGEMYPDYEYDDWSKIVKSLMPKDEEESNNVQIFIPTRVSVIGDTYNKVLEKLQGMIEWAESSSVPLERWSVNGVSKWAKQYNECLELCKCLELDYYDKDVDEELYNKISEALSLIEDYTSRLPKVKTIDTSYLDADIPLNIARCKKIKIPEYYTRRDKYLTFISSIPPTTISERRKLMKRYHNGDMSALDAVIESFLPMVYNLAEQFHAIYPNIDLQDFIGEGVCVLVSDFVRYEEKYGKYIVGYVMGSIKDRMARFAAGTNSLISLPLNMETYRREIERQVDIFEELNEREPNEEELSEILELPIDRIKPILNLSCEYFGTRNDLFEIDSDFNADKGLLHESLSQEIGRALFTLTPREADILRKSFGLGTQEKTLEEIGDELHLTRERVRQIEVKAIRKLNSGQRSHILMTYLGGSLLSQGEIEARDREIALSKRQERERLITPDIQPIPKQKINNVSSQEEWEEMAAIGLQTTEIRSIIDALNKWLESKRNTPSLKMEEIEDWKKKNEELDNKYSALEKKQISQKTLTELRRAIRELRKQYPLLSAFVAAPQRPKEDNGCSRSGMYWTEEEERKLGQLFMQDVSCESIAKQLSRSELAIQLRLAKLGFLEYNEETKTYIKVSSSAGVLKTYMLYFKDLKRSVRNYQKAPHKVILMLAVLALYKSSTQQQTEILVKSPALINLFDQYWQKNVHSTIWTKDINMPWKHMISEPFWHYNEKTKTTYIDKELRDLLKETENRVALREVLREQLKN